LKGDPIYIERLMIQRMAGTLAVPQEKGGRQEAKPTVERNMDRFIGTGQE